MSAETNDFSFLHLSFQLCVCVCLLWFVHAWLTYVAHILRSFKKWLRNCNGYEACERDTIGLYVYYMNVRAVYHGKRMISHTHTHIIRARERCVPCMVTYRIRSILMGEMHATCFHTMFWIFVVVVTSACVCINLYEMFSFRSIKSIEKVNKWDWERSQQLVKIYSNIQKKNVDRMVSSKRGNRKKGWWRVSVREKGKHRTNEN